ncbi:hypothetical protein VNO78_25091 [Psophocarpus tetragonolobus]|uniref:RNase H type-1 domain-containing protein n=1 Tax=Psophocarpus tetragonolobus TaxID=3891 RepID=A0AAN9S6G3_PSOTE
MVSYWFSPINLDYGLFDLPLTGYPFTWAHENNPINLVEKRLNRAMATASWKDIFLNRCLRNSLVGHSDQSPIWLRLHNQGESNLTYHFKFENAWLAKPDLEGVPWLRGTSSALVQTPIMEGFEDLHIIDLMNIDLGTWNLPLIKDLFVEDDVNAITRTPSLDIHGKIGVGMCLRDRQDAFILARTRCFNFLSLLHEVEATTLEVALHWITHLHLENVIFQSDCQRLVLNL